MAREQDRTTGDYNRYWANRDYVGKVRNVRASVFLVHGINDWNVKTRNFARFWAAPARHHVPRKIWLHQGGHGGPSGDTGYTLPDGTKTGYTGTVHRWMDHWLYGVDNGVTREPTAIIQREDKAYRAYAGWPDPGVRPTRLRLSATGDGTGTTRTSPRCWWTTRRTARRRWSPAAGSTRRTACRRRGACRCARATGTACASARSRRTTCSRPVTAWGSSCCPPITTTRCARSPPHPRPVPQHRHPAPGALTRPSTGGGRRTGAPGHAGHRVMATTTTATKPPMTSRNTAANTPRTMPALRRVRGDDAGGRARSMSTSARQGLPGS